MDKLIKESDKFKDKYIQLDKELSKKQEAKAEEMSVISNALKLLDERKNDPKSKITDKTYKQRKAKLEKQLREVSRGQKEQKIREDLIKTRKKIESLELKITKKEKKEEKAMMKDESKTIEEEKKEKKETKKAIAQVRQAMGEKLKRGEARQAETPEILSLRGQIRNLGKKKLNKNITEEEEKQINKLMAEKRAKIDKLKKEPKTTEATEEPKTTEATEEPKTTEALREMARESQQALIDSAEPVKEPIYKGPIKEGAKQEGKKEEEEFSEKEINAAIIKAEIKQSKRLASINNAKGTISMLEKMIKKEPERKEEIDEKIKELKSAISETYDKIIERAPNYQIAKYKQQKKDFEEGKEEKLKLSYKLQQIERELEEPNQKEQRKLKPSEKQKQTEPEKFKEPLDVLKEEGRKIFSKESNDKKIIKKAQDEIQESLKEKRISDIATSLGPISSYEEIIKKREEEYEERKKPKTVMEKSAKMFSNLKESMGSFSESIDMSYIKNMYPVLNTELGNLEKNFRNEYGGAPEDEIARQAWLAEPTSNKASSSRDTGSDFIDNRQNNDKDNFNPNIRVDDWYDIIETNSQNEHDLFYNYQDKKLNPTEYENKYLSYGQEENLQIEYKYNIEKYDRMIESQISEIAILRNKSIRDKDGKVDPNKQYTLGDYFQMFNFDDSAKKEQKGRLIDEIRTFARENMIPMVSEYRLEDMSVESLKSIAVDLEIAEDLTIDTYGSNFGNLLDLYETSRKIGLNNKILERPEIKDTYMGRALKRLDQEMGEGSLKNIKSKFGDILKGMTIPIKAFVGELGIGDIATGLKAFKSGYDIVGGFGRTIFGGEEKEKEEKEEKEETNDERIIKELENMRNDSKKFKGQDGLYYPKSQPITPYRFPEPNENYNGVRLIQNAVTNWLNDTSLYGGMYTSEFYNEI